MLAVIGLFLPDAGRAQGSLDDTAGFIHVAATPPHVLTCDTFSVAVSVTVTNGRVFDVKLNYDSDNYELAGYTAGTHPSLNLLPIQTVDDTLVIDGFFHPNFTGTTVLATLQFLAVNMSGDQVTTVGFFAGQGYSGNGDNAEPILFNGDTTTIMLEGTPPLPPEKMIIYPPPPPTSYDSLFMSWSRVYHDTDGDTVINPKYNLYFKNIYSDSVFLIKSTFDSFAWDDEIQTGVHHITYDSLGFPVDTTSVGIYFVRAKKTQP
jgi:hypothetical protein